MNLASFIRIGLEALPQSQVRAGLVNLQVYLLDPELERLLAEHQSKKTSLDEAENRQSAGRA